MISLSILSGWLAPRVRRFQNATPHSLPGTVGKIDFGRGLTGTLFRFRRNGRWEIVPARQGSIGAVGSSYSVSGSTLTTVDQDDAAACCSYR